MKTVLKVLALAVIGWMLTSCGGGPVASLKSPNGDTVTILSSDLTDRYPIGCNTDYTGCQVFSNSVFFVWFTGASLGALSNAYVLDIDVNRFGVGCNGLDAGKTFISFNNIPSTSSGFTLYWGDNTPVSLGR